MKSRIIITCDGPAASGKSTIAQLLAHKLEIAFLSSGWFYRALAYLLINYEKYTLETLSTATDEHIEYYLNPKFLRYEYKNGSPRIYFHDVRLTSNDNKTTHISFEEVDITPYLKDVMMDRGSIILSPLRVVRDAIMDLQHEFVRAQSCIIEGRDCGSVVFPHADFKFYITADLSVRASRWRDDQAQRGEIFTQTEAEKIINDRDERDKNRSYGALVIPENAIIIDTGSSTIEQTVAKMYKIVTVRDTQKKE